MVFQCLGYLVIQEINRYTFNSLIQNTASCPLPLARAQTCTCCSNWVHHKWHINALLAPLAFFISNLQWKLGVMHAYLIHDWFTHGDLMLRLFATSVLLEVQNSPAPLFVFFQSLRKWVDVISQSSESLVIWASDPLSVNFVFFP